MLKPANWKRLEAAWLHSSWTSMLAYENPHLQASGTLKTKASIVYEGWLTTVLVLKWRRIEEKRRVLKNMKTFRTEGASIEIWTGRLSNRNRKTSLFQIQIPFLSPTIDDHQQPSRIYSKQLQINLGHYKQSAKQPVGLPEQKLGVIKSDGHVVVNYTSTQSVCRSTSIQSVI